MRDDHTAAERNHVLGLLRAQFAVEWTGAEFLVMGDDGAWLRVADLMADMAELAPAA